MTDTSKFHCQEGVITLLIQQLDLLFSASLDGNHFEIYLDSVGRQTASIGASDGSLVLLQTRQFTGAGGGDLQIVDKH